MKLVHPRRLAPVALAVLLVALLATQAMATNDFYWDRQYGPQQIQAESAWTKSTGGDVIIAVVDTGVDVDHPDLKDKLIILPGSDFGDNDDNPDDEIGHGTHVAGTAAAITNNGIGVAGMAPTSPIMPIKIWGESFTVANFVAAAGPAIKFAVDNGAKVINLSIATFGPLDAAEGAVTGSLETPCTDAFLRGALCIIAAGNSGDQPSGYDRDLNAVIVTANDKDGRHADFGQHADTKWALSAPGVAIMSTIPLERGEYAELQGTSMATPHVAGVAALLFAQGLGPEQVAERLVDTADQMPDRRVNGAGRVNAARAVGAPVAAPQIPDAPAGDTGGGEASAGPGGGSTGSAGSDFDSGLPTDNDTAAGSLDDLGDDAFAGSDELAFEDGGESQVAARQSGVEIRKNVVLTYTAILLLITAAAGSFLVRRRSQTA